MRLRSPVLFLSSFALSLAVVGGCDRGSTPEAETPVAAQPQEEWQPDPNSDWGDGTVRGMARLKWGLPAPEGGTLQIAFWRNSDVVQTHELPATGPGPWAFEFTVDTTGFSPDDRFSVGPMLVVPPEGEAWYMGDPPTVQIWKYGAEAASIDVVIIPVDPAVAGDGPPPE